MLKNDIKFLGTSGSKKDSCGSSCVQVADNIVIDAGNIINGLKDEARFIEHIFLTHSHLDHINDIAFLVDIYLSQREVPIKVYGLKETLKALNEHIFNWSIWPDFGEISLVKSDYKSIEFIEITVGTLYKFEDVTLKPIALNHTVPTCGYVIKKDDFSVIYASDTYISDEIWKEANSDLDIDAIIIDVSFPSDFEELAKASKHLTPRLLKKELSKLTRAVDIFVTHIKPSYLEQVKLELDILGVLRGNGRVIEDGEYLRDSSLAIKQEFRVMEISDALIKEKDLGKILGLILKETMDFTNAEGGTIYLKEGDKLSFKAVKNDLLNIYEVNHNFPKINIYPNGKANSENVSAVCALSKKTINIPDVYLYHIGEFNFEGTKKFDKLNNYRTKSMLIVPMINQDDEVVGVMQLINKRVGKDIDEFNQKDIKMSTIYANLSASAIAKNQLIEDLENLVISFLESISYALSVKSPYGYGHISRVKELMKNVLLEINEDATVYKNINYTKEQLQELELAAWMHDIGKISTPDYILDKATRLEGVNDSIETIKMRFSYVKYALKYQMQTGATSKNYKKVVDQLDGDLEFIKTINKPSSFLRYEDVQKIKELGETSFTIDGETISLLTANEVKNLSIIRGTLTEQERQKINEHVQITHNMLKMITFPKKYSKVTEIASGHHEKLNGKGYPLGLKADEISFETRVLAIVDILEALTAGDRPYKKAKTKEDTFEVLDTMVKKGELDATLIDFIKKVNIFEKYIEKKKVELVGEY